MTITQPVLAMCRAKGIRLIAYWDDDFLVLARNWRQLVSHTSIVLDILGQAEIKRNLKKCHLHPRQKFEYLPAVGLEGIASDASGGQDHKIFVD